MPSTRLVIAILAKKPAPLWAHNPKVVSEANGRAVVNDSTGDCQSREVTEDKFFAENLARPVVQIHLPKPKRKNHPIWMVFCVCVRRTQHRFSQSENII